MKIHIRSNKHTISLLVFVALFIVGQVIVYTGVIKITGNIIFYNQSGSMPEGLYLAIPMGSLKKGDIVRVKLPEDMKIYAIQRGWMKSGNNLLKKIGALEGDNYQVDDHFFSINGKYIGPVYEKDSQGLPMPRLRGEFTVKKGYFLPIATHMPNSFDGRYFGDVPIASIKGKVIPLWVKN